MENILANVHFYQTLPTTPFPLQTQSHHPPFHTAPSYRVTFISPRTIGNNITHPYSAILYLFLTAYFSPLLFRSFFFCFRYCLWTCVLPVSDRKTLNRNSALMYVKIREKQTTIPKSGQPKKTKSQNNIEPCESKRNQIEFRRLSKLSRLKTRNTKFKISKFSPTHPAASPFFPSTHHIHSIQKKMQKSR